jgi:colanic acid biosynthesis glycosyl transferase WcaI
LKVLAIHRFYWPDTPPYASMLRTIVCRWVSDGHDVDVLSSQPSYKAGIQSQKQPKKEVVDGANIVRLELPSEAGKSLVRILNALHLGVAVFWQAVIRKRYDVIMVSTSPPVLAGWFVALAAKLTGARFIYHCMDIHPEIGRISGEFRNPKVFSLLSRLDRWTCAQARPVVVLSEDMANTLAARKAGPSPETLVINNFSLPTESSVPSELPFPWPSEPFVLLFAGNIGRFQGLDVLIDAMGKLSVRSDIRLVMMGEGTEKDPLALKAEQIGARVSFFGHHSVDVAKLAMGRASFGFVSLVPELYHYAYPSKTMTYLEQGCPVLVAVEPESCLARDIVGNAAGLAVPGGDVDNLVEAISSLADDPDEVNSMRQNAREFAARGFALDVVLARWSFLLKEPSDV